MAALLPWVFALEEDWSTFARAVELLLIFDWLGVELSRMILTGCNMKILISEAERNHQSY
jgi:hypothetical protein